MEGNSSVRPGCRLTGIAHVHRDQVVIDMLGRPGQPYTIEASSDLRTWIPLGETRENAGQVVIADPQTGNPKGRFYRLRPLPE